MELNENSISTAHRLPDTKKIKNHFIVKFVHRDMREKVYKKRARLSWGRQQKIFRLSPRKLENQFKGEIKSTLFNESLTSYRNRLFGRIYEFKKSNKFKFLWTVNGRSALERARHLRFTNLQLMKNLKNFWIDEAKKHGSCYFNSIYVLCFYCY